MENILLPSKIDIIPDNDNPNRAVVVMEPLYYGYGTTIGNALRRVLLSSMPGSAVTAVKINSNTHEFSTIDFVKEDVLEIILNLKQLRLKVHSEEPVKLNLKIGGEKEVKASDIEKNADVEIINGDLVIATLTNKKAELDMEITVAQGRGYVPTEIRDKEKLESSEIAVDSIFTPIINVGYKVEAARVGQDINFDKLTLDVETDGSIKVAEAIHLACDILNNHFSLIKESIK